MSSQKVQEALELCVLTGEVERVGNGQGIRCTNPLRKDTYEGDATSWEQKGKYCVCTVFSPYIRMSPDDVTIEPKHILACPYRVINEPVAILG
jgi:hypothetical protein